jgi:hypothetical protein
MDDALLAELGGVAALSQPDKAEMPGAADSPTKDAYDVTPTPDARPLAQRADAKFSVAAGGKGYNVVVVGDYFVPSAEGKGKILKPYRLDFNLMSLDGALSVIVSKLLLPKLRKVYGSNVVNFHTHNVVEAKPLSAASAPINSLQYMDRPRLERYVAENGVPVDPKAYPDVSHLREAVIDHKLNPKGFELREAARQEDREKTAELLRMNPDIAPEPMA